MSHALETPASIAASPKLQMKMKPGEFIALSACSMMLTALGIDIMLPAFGELRNYFGLSSESTAPAHIIEFFFLGQTAQIIFGALSDRFGRLPILRVGFPLYIVGGLAATFAPTLELMFAARFVAGVGASAVFMTTIAGVRDRFVGDHMARIMSFVFTIFLFTPVLAPFLGLAILTVASWKFVFLTPPVFAVIVFMWSLRLEESLLPDQRSALKWTGIIQSIKTVVGNRIFIRYTAITTLLFGALSSYVSSSEYMVGEIYGQPDLFPWVFAGIGLVMACCTLINSRFSLRYGARRTIMGLITAYAVVATTLLLYTLLYGDPPAMAVFIAGIGMLMALNLAIEPNSSALAMEPMGNMAGIASAVYGTIFFFTGASVGSAISQLMVNGVLPIVVSCFIIGIVTVILAYTDRRPISRGNHA